jgi:glycosyltransferase involved in cell wall biosynthesis
MKLAAQKATTNALVVSRHFPYSSQGGSGGIFQRLGVQVRALAEVVDRVHCLFLMPVEQQYSPQAVAEHEERLRRLWSPAVSIQLASTLIDNEAATVWQRLGKGVFVFCAQPVVRQASTSPTIEAVTAALSTRPDVVLVHRLDSMCVFMAIAHRAPERLPAVPIYFDLDDIGHVARCRRLLRHPAWPRERLYLLQVPRMLVAEFQAIRLATATFVCSDADRLYLRRFPGVHNVLTVPNSVVIPDLEAGDVSEPIALFVGGAGVAGNAHGVDVLVRKVWPTVHAHLPEARLVVIGAGHKISCSADGSIIVAGFVDDLAPWYRRAGVVCCPIYVGAGTRVKIIEAAAHGKCIVSTPVGAEGLDFEDGREIILRETPAELAAACIQLLSDPNLALRLGRAAYERARANYERGSAIDRLAVIFRTGFSKAFIGSRVA